MYLGSSTFHLEPSNFGKIQASQVELESIVSLSRLSWVMFQSILLWWMPNTFFDVIALHFIICVVCVYVYYCSICPFRLSLLFAETNLNRATNIFWPLWGSGEHNIDLSSPFKMKRWFFTHPAAIRSKLSTHLQSFFSDHLLNLRWKVVPVLSPWLILIIVYDIIQLLLSVMLLSVAWCCSSWLFGASENDIYLS